MGTGEILSLSNLSGADELFGQELVKVLTDILDPNKQATAKRSVTLTYTITPDSGGGVAETDLTVKSKLAPRAPHKNKIWIDHDGETAVAVEESPAQRPLFPGDDEKQPENVTSIDQKKENEQQ